MPIWRNEFRQKRNNTFVRYNSKIKHSFSFYPNFSKLRLPYRDALIGFVSPFFPHFLSAVRIIAIEIVLFHLQLFWPEKKSPERHNKWCKADWQGSTYSFHISTFGGQGGTFLMAVPEWEIILLGNNQTMDEGKNPLNTMYCTAGNKYSTKLRFFEVY